MRKTVQKRSSTAVFSRWTFFTAALGRTSLQPLPWACTKVGCKLPRAAEEEDEEEDEEDEEDEDDFEEDDDEDDDE